MWNKVLPTTLVVLSEIILLALPGVKAASAFPLIAGTKWLGVDGTWSHFDFRIGTNSQQSVSVTVSTALSEIWVVETTGCKDNNPLCTAARGGVYDIKTSKSWNSLGAWQLGLNHVGTQGNGDYAQEHIMINNPVLSRSLSLDNVLVAGINYTSYFTGFIGVGATQGTFNDGKAANPLINQLAETTGDIPSHSYGYTAGAFYAGPNGALVTTEATGTPASLTLGGYDKNRFVPHDITFNLPVNEPKPIQVPQVLLRGITAKVSSTDKAPTKDWTSTSRSLYGMNESTSAIIDSSTPYLWLPPAVCDRFASALGLVWNANHSTYLFADNERFGYFAQQKELSFDFSISSFDNRDNFGQPLGARGVVNITLSSAAFAQSYKYGSSIVPNFGDPAVPYFPLKRTTAGQPIIIGRVFMQEAYLITKYEENTFSIHQAKFPENPRSNMDIVDIARHPNNMFPAFNGPAGSSGLDTAAIAGIAVAACITIGVAVLIFWCCRRRKRRAEEKKKKATSTIGSDSTLKCSESTMEPDSPNSPIERIFSFLWRGRTRRVPDPEPESGKAVEVSADAHHERFEMPAPLPPAELDGMDGPDMADDTTELGTEGSHNLSAYEVARRKMHRQLQGPVPTYTPPEPGTNVGAIDEKSEQDVSPVAHYRPSETVSAPSSAPTYSQSGSQRDTLPSPLSPNGDWTNRFDGLPSPMTFAPPFPSPLFPGNGSGGASGSNHSNSDTAVSPQSPHHPSSSDSLVSRSSSAASPSSLGPPPTGAYQRTPIDPSRVVCLGPLPENVQINSSSQFKTAPTVPRLMMPEGRARARGGGAGGNGSAAIAAAAAAAAAGAAGPSTPAISVSPARENAEAQDGEQEGDSGEDTLGSNFTDDEGGHHADQQAGQPQRVSLGPHPPPSPQSPLSPASPHSIDPGSELVHVPQMAERRYSWEEGTTQ